MRRTQPKDEPSHPLKLRKKLAKAEKDCYTFICWMIELLAESGQNPLFRFEGCFFSHLLTEPID